MIYILEPIKKEKKSFNNLINIPIHLSKLINRIKIKKQKIRTKINIKKQNKNYNLSKRKKNIIKKENNILTKINIPSSDEKLEYKYNEENNLNPQINQKENIFYNNYPQSKEFIKIKKNLNNDLDDKYYFQEDDLIQDFNSFGKIIKIHYDNKNNYKLQKEKYQKKIFPNDIKNLDIYNNIIFEKNIKLNVKKNKKKEKISQKSINFSPEIKINLKNISKIFSFITPFPCCVMN